MPDRTEILVKSYLPSENNPTVFPVNDREVLRYAGYMGLPKSDETDLKELLDRVKAKAAGICSFKVCYMRCPIEWKEGMPLLPFKSDSKALAKCLDGCGEIIMFAATAGLELDRLTARTRLISPAEALILQGFGAERVEALCDAFCDEQKQEAALNGLRVTPRFSPGYGDLKLEVQKEFFSILDINRKVGISLGDNLLMTPTKSVTALFGLSKI